MTGKKVLEKLKAMSPSEIIALGDRARKCDPRSIGFYVALGIMTLCTQKKIPEADVETLLDNTKVRVAYE